MEHSPLRPARRRGHRPRRRAAAPTTTSSPCATCSPSTASSCCATSTGPTTTPSPRSCAASATSRSPAARRPLDGHPDLNLISNVGRATPPRSNFHIDTGYVARPPAYTALRAVEIPEQGGQTLFSNQYRAHDTLPDDLRARVAGRTLRHVVTGLELGPDDEAAAEHPVLRPHPVSGRVALYLDAPKRCAAVSGMDDDAAAETVTALLEHSTREDNVHRHDWRPGDVVIWDNGAVMHKADHAGVVGDRVMHRGMVATYPAVGRRMSLLRTTARTLGTQALLAAALPANLAVTAAALARSAVVGAPPRAHAGTAAHGAAQRREDDQGAGPRAGLPRGGPPGRARRVGASTASPGTASPAPSTPSTPSRPPTTRATSTPWWTWCAARASTSTCRCAARRRAGTTRWPSRCSSSTARCCTATPRRSAPSTTRPRSPRPPVAHGLPVPDTHRVTSAAEVAAFAFPADGPSYVLKSIPYDAVHRLDLTLLPRPTRRGDGRGRRGPADLGARRRGSCRSSCAAGSTAPTAPRATGAWRSTAAASPRRSRSTTPRSTCRRSRSG